MLFTFLKGKKKVKKWRICDYIVHKNKNIYYLQGLNLKVNIREILTLELHVI